MREIRGKYSTFPAAIHKWLTNNRAATLALNLLPNSQDLLAITKTFRAICSISSLFGTQGRGCACVTGATQLKGTIYISGKTCVLCSLGISLERQLVLFAAEPLNAGDTISTFAFASALV